MFGYRRAKIRIYFILQVVNLFMKIFRLKKTENRQLKLRQNYKTDLVITQCFTLLSDHKSLLYLDY